MPADTPTIPSDPAAPDAGTRETPHTLVSRLALASGQLLFRKLGVGTFDECERLADEIPALVWNGSVAVHQADLLTMPSSDWLDIGQGHDVVSYMLSDADLAARATAPTPSDAGRDQGEAGRG